MLSPVGGHGKRPRADIGKAVRHYVSAIAFLTTLVVVVGTAGCGQRAGARSGEAPSGSDLAADALAALEDKGSAHFVSDFKTTLPGYSDEAALTIHAEGDASASAVDLDGTVSVGGLTISGQVLVDAHNVFVEFMGEWYGEDQGLADALRDAHRSYNGASPWDDWATPEGLRRNFDQLFTGEVSAGPLTDGVETWQFEGRLNADGLARLGDRYGEPTLPKLNQKFADASHVRLVVGRDDHLPRRLELTVKMSPEDLKELSNDGAANFESTLVLSDFGKPVEVHAPPSVTPLDELFDKLFPGFE